MTSQSQESPIVNISDFNPESDINFAKMKVNDFGGKNVGIMNSNTKKGLMLNTPLMLTWGAQENDFDGKKSYDMALQFPSEEWQTPKTDEFLEKMKTFEAKIKAAVIANSKEWMNKGKLTPEVADALWSPMLRYPKNKETDEPDYTRPPTLKVKIPFWKGEFNTEIFDMDNNALFPNDNGILPMQLIPKGTNVALCLQSGGIWFASGKFGVTWKLFQAVVKPRASLRGRCHIGLDQDDKERLKKQVVKEEEEEEDNVAVEDSDGGEDEEEDKVETPPPSPTPQPPAPKKKKKVVRKKKGGD